LAVHKPEYSRPFTQDAPNDQMLIRADYDRRDFIDLQGGKDNKAIGLMDTRYACVHLINPCAIRQYEGSEHIDIRR